VGGAINRWLIRAQKPRSKAISCKGQVAGRHYKGQHLSSYTQHVPGQLAQLSNFSVYLRQLSQLSRNMLSVAAEMLPFIVPPCDDPCTPSRVMNEARLSHLPFWGPSEGFFLINSTAVGLTRMKRSSCGLRVRVNPWVNLGERFIQVNPTDVWLRKKPPHWDPKAASGLNALRSFFVSCSQKTRELQRSSWGLIRLPVVKIGLYKILFYF